MNLFATWKRLSPLPGGRWLFNRIVNWRVPYTGSICPYVEEIRPGYARIRVKDRRRIRNHLNSIHAVALMNLAEAASGLAVICALAPSAKGILTRFTIDFAKKARGTLIAESTTSVPAVTERVSHEVSVSVLDCSGTVVCSARATWLLQPA